MPEQSKKHSCNFCTRPPFVKFYVRWDVLHPIPGVPVTESRTMLFCDGHLKHMMDILKEMGAIEIAVAVPR